MRHFVMCECTMQTSVVVRLISASDACAWRFSHAWLCSPLDARPKYSTGLDLVSDLDLDLDLDPKQCVSGGSGGLLGVQCGLLVGLLLSGGRMRVAWLKTVPLLVCATYAQGCYHVVLVLSYDAVSWCSFYF